MITTLEFVQKQFATEHTVHVCAHIQSGESRGWSNSFGLVEAGPKTLMALCPYCYGRLRSTIWGELTHVMRPGVSLETKDVS
jgi:hypothetical protein